jgi:hypothetical protein
MKNKATSKGTDRFVKYFLLVYTIPAVLSLYCTVASIACAYVSPPILGINKTRYKRNCVLLLYG